MKSSIFASFTGGRTACLALGAVVVWFAAGEIATQAWYAWRESKKVATKPWEFQWPAANDAVARGFFDFQERELTTQEREILRFQSAHAYSWRTPAGASWIAFYIQWPRDPRLNEMDLIHNPTLCLPSAGIMLDKQLPPVVMEVQGTRVRFHAWQFRFKDDLVFAFVGTRWNYNFEMLDYGGNLQSQREGKIRRAIEGNRENPLQSLEFVGAGFDSFERAKAGLEEQIKLLGG